jgi:hypothetical protein
MSPNGHAALQLLALDPVAAPKPDTGTPIVVDVGDAMAEAVAGICCGMAEFQNVGRLTTETKAVNGDRIAVLAMAMLAHGGSDADFFDRARVAARCEVRRRFDPEGFNAAEVDAATEFCIGAVFEIVTRVVETERAWRVAHAN